MLSAIVTGIEALRWSGWTTQITYRPQIAFGEDVPYFEHNDFYAEPRSQAWFSAVRPHILSQHNLELQLGKYCFYVQVLSPSWALADMLHRYGWGHGFGLWPDDIEWDQVTFEDEITWKAAARVFSLPTSRLLSMREKSR